MNTVQQKAVFILSGGPAPGGMEVAEAFRAACMRHGVACYGSRHGFAPLMQFGVKALVELDESVLHTDNCYRPPKISFGRGGPGVDPKLARELVTTLLEHGFNYLVVFGGDGSANTVLKLYEQAEQLRTEGAGWLQMGVLPKSMDRDLPVDTIGFATVGEYVGRLCINARRDAQYSDKGWSLIETQGRTAGHVAFQAARSAEASILLIPEQFPPSEYPKGVEFSLLRDILIGAMLKVLVGPEHRPYEEPLWLHGRMHGLAILAEGVADRVRSGTLPDLDLMRQVSRPGHFDHRALQLHKHLERAVNTSLEKMRVAERLSPHATLRIGSEFLGTTTRGAAPNTDDCTLARELGTAIVHQLVKLRKSGVVAYAHGDKIGEISLRDFANGRDKIEPREVDPRSDRYRTEWHRTVASRLTQEDFQGEMCERLAAVAGMTPSDFRCHFHRAAEWGSV